MKLFTECVRRILSPSFKFHSKNRLQQSCLNSIAGAITRHAYVQPILYGNMITNRSEATLRSTRNTQRSTLIQLRITHYELSPDFAQVVHIFERLQSEYRIMGLTYCKNSSIMFIG